MNATCPWAFESQRSKSSSIDASVASCPCVCCPNRRVCRLKVRASDAHQTRSSKVQTSVFRHLTRPSWKQQTRTVSVVTEASGAADVESNRCWRLMFVTSTPPRPMPPSQQRANEGKPPNADVSVRRSRDQRPSHDQELIFKFCFWFLFALFSYELVQVCETS
jgi:hypothetical protein